MFPVEGGSDRILGSWQGLARPQGGGRAQTPSGDPQVGGPVAGACCTNWGSWLEPDGACHLVGRKLGSAGPGALPPGPAPCPPQSLRAPLWGHEVTPSPSAAWPSDSLGGDWGLQAWIQALGLRCCVTPGRSADHSAPQFLYFAGRWPGLILRPALCRHADLTLIVILAEGPCLSGRPSAQWRWGSRAPDRTLGAGGFSKRGGFPSQDRNQAGPGGRDREEGMEGPRTCLFLGPGAEWGGGRELQEL